MSHNNDEHIDISKPVDNVFKDLYPEKWEAHTAKVEIAYLIEMTIEKLGITQAQAAKIMRIDPADVSRICRGVVTNFEFGRLFSCLLNLSYDIELKIKPHRDKDKHITRLDVILPKRLASSEFRDYQ